MNHKTLIAIALSLSFWPAVARAETLPLDSEQMVRLSEEIVVGKVTDQAVRWNEQKNLIVTDYKISTERHLKGSSRKTLMVAIPGGTLDGETHETTLTTHLNLGNRYIFFIENSKQRTLSPFTGSWQGWSAKWSIPTARASPRQVPAM